LLCIVFDGCMVGDKPVSLSE